jgi:hypothetical protein
MMPKRIFLLSDQVIHWNILPGADRKNVYLEHWGNHSIEKFMNCIKSEFSDLGLEIDWSLLDNGMTVQNAVELNPANAACNHVFATWKSYPEGKNKVWRIEEIAHIGQSGAIEPHPTLFDNLDKADLLLIQDWGMKIHDLEIPNLEDQFSDKWVIYRPFPPIFTGRLWHSIRHSLDKRGIIVLRASDLRMLDVSISKGLSWEQTIQDLITEIYCKRNLSLHPLQTAGYVIISFGQTGTLLLQNEHSSAGVNPNIQLFFDSMGVEGYWEIAHPGYLPGSMELLMVLLAKAVLYPHNADELSFTPALRAHLLESRALHLTGAKVSEGSLSFDCLPGEFSKVYGTKPSQEFRPVTLEFDLFKCLFDAKHGTPASGKKDWSLLSKTKWDFYSLARKIALRGPMEALSGWNIPIAKYNFLITVDRKEIEFLHHLQSLFTEYLQQKNNQPLSIAVFGAPGSGKSFSIKQLAKSLGLPGYEIQSITFNLSQFNVDHPSDLYQAFHAVRDIALSGKIPLVFWDEFDSKSLGWLRYFLAPMEDGEFQEGQLIHYIGKSIFVFAGGTCSSMQAFEEKAKGAVAEKGPDFLSRIKGFINVMGPNPVLHYTQADTNLRTPEDETTQFILAKNADPEYIIRRAILMNSLLNIGYKNLFENGELRIDDGVLHAFLLVPKYKHGTRSMQTIFKISQLFGKDKFHRSDLPPVSQMDMHVDGELFYDLMSQQARYYDGGESFYHLVDEINFDEGVVEKMAAGVYAIYSLVFSSNKVDNPLSITKEEFMAFYEKMKALPEGMPHDEVSQNYHNARNIPKKLAAVGYGILPLDAKQPAGTLSEGAFEIVSRLEHVRWVRHHIDNGWSYAPIKNKPLKQHDALVAWDEEERQNAAAIYGKSYTQKMGIAEGEILSEYYRNLDRVITLAIPWILECVGFQKVKIMD